MRLSGLRELNDAIETEELAMEGCCVEVAASGNCDQREPDHAGPVLAGDQENAENDQRKLPDQSAVESGLPGLIVSTWSGVLAPAGTPRAIVNKLNFEFAKAVNAPDMVERYAAVAAEVYTTTPEEFAKVVRDDFAKWSKVVKGMGLKAN